MKYFLCEHCDSTNEVKGNFRLLVKCQHCKKLLNYARTYKNKDDLQHTEKDQQAVMKIYKYMFIALLVLSILTDIFKTWELFLLHIHFSQLCHSFPDLV